MKTFFKYISLAAGLTLLAMGISRCQGEDQTPLIDKLFRAAFNGQKDEVIALIKSGVDVNAKGETGETALIGAATGEHKDIVELLITAGADINAKSTEGQTALFQVSSHDTFKAEEIIAFLCSKGIDVNAQDNNGDTALMFAAGWNLRYNVKKLLECHANPNIKNNSGKTAADFTTNDEVKQMLRDAMEKTKPTEPPATEEETKEPEEHEGDIPACVYQESEISLDCAYKLFRLNRHATGQDIKKAHHRLARMWHPDKHPDKKKAEHMMQRINAAFDVIEKHHGHGNRTRE